MAGIGTNPGAAEKFRFRYQYLLIEIGTKLLRHLFDYRIDKDIVKYLVCLIYEGITLQKLIRENQITFDQSQYLPPVDMKPDSSKFSISLLNCLLRHVCFLKHPDDPVWYNPSSTDTSVEADIARLSIYRNWARLQLPHSGTVFISEAEFTAKWNELSEILNRLNIVGGIPKIPNLSALINDAEKMDIDEKLEKKHHEAFETWLKLDKYYLEVAPVDLSLDAANSIVLNDMKRAAKEQDQALILKDSNIIRLHSKLIELGTAVLQKHFDYRVGNDFANYLTSHETEKTTLQWLIDTNRITIQQVTLLPEFLTTSSSYVHKSEQALIPPSDQAPLKSPKLDISLLTVLLRHVCGLRAPNDLVWKGPLPKDMSIEADISRLGQCRNSIMKLNRVDEQKIDELWNELREILTRLGRDVGITDNLFSSTGYDYLDKFNMNTLKEWYDNDQRVIQIEQKYAQRDIFKDSDYDAWTIDEKNVSVLLSEGILPNAKQLIKICEKFGSSSRPVRKVCAYICNTLQMTSHHIKRCWPAYVYDKYNETDTNMVTFVAIRDIEEELNIDQIFGYNIYELFHDSHSAETWEMMKHDIENYKMDKVEKCVNKHSLDAETSEMMKHDIENYKMDKVEECVNKHSLDLMHSHSNITLIMGSSVKSIGYRSKNEEIIKKPCIAIYVHKKGYIPLGEKEFPTQLDEFDTDVRECEVSLFVNPEAFKKHDHLLMGTSIGTE